MRKQPTIEDIIEKYTPDEEELKAFINFDLGPMEFKIEGIDFTEINSIDLGEMNFTLDIPELNFDL